VRGLPVALRGVVMVLLYAPAPERILPCITGGERTRSLHPSLRRPGVLQFFARRDAFVRFFI